MNKTCPPAWLVVDDVSFAYGRGPAVNQSLRLALGPGIVGLLGPNGAGKSTLMRMLATLARPRSGRILWHGTDIAREPDALRATLGYLPQDFGVYPRVSAWDMLDHLAVLKGLTAAADRRETVETLLRQVNLWDVRKKAIAGFSGGMRQRFGIAQAMIGNPTLMIVDEPTAGLDPEERNRFNNLLAEIGATKVVILSTHIVDDVTDLCSRMAILVDGRIVSAGTPAALIEGLKGKVWTRAVEAEELPGLRKQFELISTRLRGGRTVIHVLSDAAPDPRFEPVSAGLAEVYFSTLHAQRKANGQPTNDAARSAAAH
jgi:ABC-2 type transport system ATP-binding protein